MHKQTKIIFEGFVQYIDNAGKRTYNGSMVSGKLYDKCLKIMERENERTSEDHR